ncbi:DJ-1/PfpI family protein [Mycoplasma phocimorsus]|uniref:DJ-1/PfpI family protein n=1 Tax=Mycoplasma phocimorsus TaxID=3045839 RepID=A0AAJ1UX30_9MOLU|nr:DJ-1/PfpI family protein [Mycoplasma phocimorsus]MDJ1645940.1 DJ-1/PfpI family protein [Mycoplasma phocimorsus]MDJ1647194.1 DJ-1/PfpI family protein [Mycoplasma phocimorsus]
MKLLVVSYNNYNDIELTTPLTILRKADPAIEIEFYNPLHEKQGTLIKGQHKIIVVESLTYWPNVINYDAIFIPGGQHCLTMREDNAAIEIARYFLNNNKPVFAICDAGNVLYEKGIIENYSYSSYPIKDLQAGKRNTSQTSICNNLITGKSPYAAYELGLLMVKTLYSEELKNQIKSALNPKG